MDSLDEKTIEHIQRPFPKELIKKAAGSGGQKTYVEIAAYIHRLNQVFGYAWSFEITSREIFWDADEVVVVGRLTAGGVTKEQIGNCSIQYHKDKDKKEKDTSPKNTVSIGDNIKAAVTDSLKKCATQFGIGLDLYGDYEGKVGKKASTSSKSGAGGKKDAEKDSPPMPDADMQLFMDEIKVATAQPMLDGIAERLKKTEMSVKQRNELTTRWKIRRDALKEEGK